MPTYTEADQIRAHLDHDAWVASLTDEQRERLGARRRILGSLDETAALNRAEVDR